MLRWLVPFAAALAVWGCSRDLAMTAIHRDLKAEKIDDAVREVDEFAAREPNSFDVQYARGTVHREAAVRAMAAGDEAAYLTHVETALDAYTRASSFDPRQAGPHTGVAKLLLYQGDLKGAREELLIARMLDPVDPMHTAELAQVYVYMGRLSRARSLVEQGRKQGLPPVFAETVEMLASWREGDLTDARDLFDLAHQNPKPMHAWLREDPSTPADFASFDEFAKYCCGATTCGPHMGDACERMHQAVKQREVAAETLRRERIAALEREKARRKTFGGTRELEIEAERQEQTEEETEQPAPPAR
jgi:tetratricopeptide (TPR) repeat protein